MATNAKFVKNPAGWKAAFHSWEGTLGVWMREKNENVATIARIEAPKSKPSSVLIRGRTAHVPGGLTKSIKTSYGKTPTGELEAKTIADAPYAVYVHEGTRRHRITANRPGKKLTFVWPSRAKIVFDDEVMHPGTKPNKFLSRALAKVF